MFRRLMLPTLLCLALGCFPWSSPVPGQEIEEAAVEAGERPIETDRDSFTRSPRVVERSRCVLEGSYSFLEQDAAYHHLLHEEAEKVEEGMATYGAKIQLTTEDGWLPTSALIGTGYTPTSGESNDTDFSLEYAAGWELLDRWEIGAGLRWFSLAEQHDRFTEWAPSLVLKTPLRAERISAHVEYFTLLSAGREENYQQHYIGPGAHYLLTPNCELGARVFWGLNKDSVRFLCNAGMGIRF